MFGLLAVEVSVGGQVISVTLGQHVIEEAAPLLVTWKQTGRSGVLISL